MSLYDVVDYYHKVREKERIFLKRRLFMADKPLIEVDRTESVSVGEVERFKVERFAERMFLSGLRVLVTELQGKVSPRNLILASMTRFLRGR